MNKETAARDWREVDDGTHRFDRVEAEVAALRALSLDNVRAFYQEHVLGAVTRRKLSVEVEGNRNGSANGGTGTASAPAAEGATEPAVAAAPAEADTSGQEGAPQEGTVEMITDIYAFKRRQALYPSFR